MLKGSSYWNLINKEQCITLIHKLNIRSREAESQIKEISRSYGIKYLRGIARLTGKVCSLNHLLHKPTLNGAVSEVLAVEILAFVAHSVPCVTGNWQFEFLVVRQTSFLSVFSWHYSCLKSIWHCLEGLRRLGLAWLHSGFHGVNIEEGVFSVVNCRRWGPVHGPETLVANSGHV